MRTSAEEAELKTLLALGCHGSKTEVEGLLEPQHNTPLPMQPAASLLRHPWMYCKNWCPLSTINIVQCHIVWKPVWAELCIWRSVTPLLLVLLCLNMISDLEIVQNVKYVFFISHIIIYRVSKLSYFWLCPVTDFKCGFRLLDPSLVSPSS